MFSVEPEICFPRGDKAFRRCMEPFFQWRCDFSLSELMEWGSSGRPSSRRTWSAATSKSRKQTEEVIILTILRLEHDPEATTRNCARGMETS